MTCYCVYKIGSEEEDWDWDDDDKEENWNWDDDGEEENWDWDDEDKQWNIEETNLDIRLGFDEGYKGYWLTIEDSDCPAVELKDYIFHNMRDIKRVSMTISQLEWVLATYGVGIPYPLAQKLVEDGLNGGYVEFLERQNDWEKLAQFHDFYNRVAFSTPRQWQPAATLPTSWQPSSERVLHHQE